MSLLNSELKKEQYELFFEMEDKHKLFEIRTTDGFPLWDIVRYNVYLSINGFDKSGHTEKINSKYIVKKIFFAVNSFLSLIKLIFNKSNVIYLGLSRNLNDNNEYYDAQFRSLKHLLPANILFLDKANTVGRYIKEKNRIFDVTRYLNRLGEIICLFVNNHNETNLGKIDKITEAVLNTFREAKVNNESISIALDNFRIEFYFYKWLFKIKKIKKILGVNGDYKAIFLAARVNGITTFELQHGDIVDNTITSNYYDPKFNKNDNIIYPDNLLLFSDIWKTGKYIPSNCIEIGTNLIKCVKKKGKEKNSICIISSYFQNDVLQELAIAVAKADTNIKIYFKLHPAQFISFDQQKSYFEKIPNIEVVAVNKKVVDMMEICDEFVALYSTAIFELLQSGKIVYILKRLNYMNFKSYFNLPNVYLIDDENSLINIRVKALQLNLNNILPIFFKPFNDQAFLKAIV